MKQLKVKPHKELKVNNFGCGGVPIGVVA